MKSKIILAVALLMGAITIAQEIEKTFVPYYLEGNTVKEFERVSAKSETLAIGFGYGGANTYLTVFDNKHSNVRFKQGQLPTFIIAVDEGADAFELVAITKGDKVKKRKKYRRFVQQGWAMGGQKDLSEHVTLPEMEKIGDNLYKMVFTTPLEAGEYAFQPILKGAQAQNITTGAGNTRIYAFGIDE